MKTSVFNRKVHRWVAVVTALPVLVVILSGIILQVKKELDWVQPSTMKGEGSEPALCFDRILNIATTVPEAEIKGWSDIDRLDVRPGKPSPLIVVKVIGADGSTAFEHQITLASLSSTQKSESSTPCPEPRPQVCTREYRPVCAKLSDGCFKTYVNGCTACTDPAVTGYREGGCE